MSHDERIERIARAIAMSDWEEAGMGGTAEGFADLAWEDFKADAEAAYRATLEAIREPSEGMRDAAYDCMSAEAGADYPSPETSWEVMIGYLIDTEINAE